MASRFIVGDAVQTPLGKGIVREARNNVRLLVEVNSRSLVLDEGAVAPLEARKKSARGTHRKGSGPTAAADPPALRERRSIAELDLHGLTVDEALARVEQALSDALLANCSELRLIHGQSGGRIRGALHRWLRSIATVRSFRLDPRNAGVTIVSL